MNDPDPNAGLYALTLTLGAAAGANVSHWGGTNAEVAAAPVVALIAIYLFETYEISEILDKGTPSKPESDEPEHEHDAGIKSR